MKLYKEGELSPSNYEYIVEGDIQACFCRIDAFESVKRRLKALSRLTTSGGATTALVGDVGEAAAEKARG